MKNQNKSQPKPDIIPSMQHQLDIKSRIKSIQVNQYLTNLQQMTNKYYRSGIDLILTQRKKKQKQYLKVYLKDINQEQMKPGNTVPRIFSANKPINIGDKFLDEKARNKLLTSERAFTKQPNIKSGIYRKRFITQTPYQQKQWNNRKFKDYDQIISQQTGPMRILLKKRIQLLHGYLTKKPIYCKLNQSNNVFSIFQADKNDFYKEQTQTICSIFSKKCRTQPTLEPSILLKQYSKYYKKKQKKNTNQFTMCSLSKMSTSNI